MGGVSGWATEGMSGETEGWRLLQTVCSCPHTFICGNPSPQGDGFSRGLWEGTGS